MTGLFRVVLWGAMSGILVMAVLPPEDIQVFNLWDKLLHGGAFFVLAVLVDLAYHGWRRRDQFALLMVYGVGIELLQAFLPYRSASPEDVLANALGALAYGLIAGAVGYCVDRAGCCERRSWEKR